ncbi:hypothetical protein [Oscillatoria sp. FACHB-1406]|uniref:hypothetical protein n=1 Tax=Oscillatoria sp. FACHB-1406 TaxID=2692846 RepID=UPI001685D007|nr:hypothetical protein [Oscillatoria sp. FACHB-1406]MBD2576573.1 hypothetical protein [Oscillatoria sp. FACHB-1406]
MFKLSSSLLLSIVLVSCASVTPPTSENGASTSPAIASSPSPRETPPTPAIAKEYLISPQGIGEARLGMKLSELKQKLAGKAEFGEDEPFMVDINAIPVRQKGEVQYYILHLSSEPLTDADPIPLLMTDNSKYRTAEGIGAGSAISLAEKVYGKATLSYNTDNESREYVRFANFPATNISFRTNGTPGNFAGTYASSQSGSAYETQDYRKDTAAIASVLIDGYRP